MLPTSLPLLTLIHPVRLWIITELSRPVVWPIITGLLKALMQWIKEKPKPENGKVRTIVLFGADGRVAKKIQLKGATHE
jgi:hypothetical protein